MWRFLFKALLHPRQVSLIAAGDVPADDAGLVIAVQLLDARRRPVRQVGAGFQENRPLVILADLALPGINRQHGVGNIGAGDQLFLNQAAGQCYGLRLVPNGYI